jgi:hypothetical protein
VTGAGEPVIVLTPDGTARSGHGRATSLCTPSTALDTTAELLAGVRLDGRRTIVTGCASGRGTNGRAVSRRGLWCGPMRSAVRSAIRVLAAGWATGGEDLLPERPGSPQRAPVAMAPPPDM